MAIPRYARRIARLPEVFARLHEQPAGVPLRELAAQLGTGEDELREDLLAYYTAGAGDWLLGLSRPTVLEFLGRDGDSEDPHEAEIVRITEDAVDLGVEHLHRRPRAAPAGRVACRPAHARRRGGDPRARAEPADRRRPRPRPPAP